MKITNKHDAIVLWTAENAQRILDSIMPRDWGDEPERQVRALELADWRAHETPPAQPPARPSRAEIVDKTWEFPVTSGNRIIGYVDLAVAYYGYRLRLRRPEGDPEAPKRWAIEPEPTRAYFEIKPKIRSAGELIRQVRMYRQYARGAYFVVSPDTRYVELLPTQGIRFIAYPGDPRIPAF